MRSGIRVHGPVEMGCASSELSAMPNEEDESTTKRGSGENEQDVTTTPKQDVATDHDPLAPKVSIFAVFLDFQTAIIGGHDISRKEGIA